MKRRSDSHQSFDDEPEEDIVQQVKQKRTKKEPKEKKATAKKDPELEQRQKECFKELVNLRTKVSKTHIDHVRFQLS